MGETTPALFLTNARTWDHEARSFVSGRSVLCEEGRITVAHGDAAPGPGAAVLDCEGAYVLPGLIDCHVHLVSNGGPNELNAVRNDPSPVQAWKAAESARRTLMAGFTTVRDLGAPAQLNVQLARAIASGLIEGPTVLAAGMGITMTGGHGHGFIAIEADGADAVRRAVREQLKAGAEAVKLFASGGVLTPGVDPKAPSFTVEELAAGVEEAHKAFRVVAAHAQAPAGIRNAVEAGVDSIEHGVWLTEQTIGMMVEDGTYLVPTLTAPGVMVERGEAEGVPRYAIDKSEMVLRDHIASFEAACRAGVRIAMGTDQGTPLSRPGENAQEMVRMARHGLSAGAAIMSATGWAAELLRVDAGRIAAGLRADFVVVRDDPLADLSALTRDDAIVAVVKGGRMVRQAPSLKLEELG